MLDAAVLIPALPLAGFLFLAFYGKRAGDPGAGLVATLAVAGSFAAACVTFLGLLRLDADKRVVTQFLFAWIPTISVDVAMLIDPLSITMALFVTGVGALIHLYSIGYMRGDERYAQFFVYLNLFVFSMLVLVLADSYLLMFVGWEGVGACSYLLIAFWFERESAAVAGKKAFVTNRVGDAGLLLAMFVLLGSVGSLSYGQVFERAPGASVLVLTSVVLLLLFGACGKSAQLPLHVWLPDAMEGPTPVSALIHAATMVTAGVYLLVRSSPLIELVPRTGGTIAVVGALTALFAASVACAQNDIKRVLAYSTISQLGFMFLAVGAGAYAAAIFHMVTHAFFKALLFLGAGSVIHAVGHASPATAARGEQDMKGMGGVRKLLPITAGTFIVGWLAIAGVPPFSGFWSKDEILAAAFDMSPALWAVGLVSAGLTAYYMTRQVMLVFYGDARWDEAREPVHESPATMVVPLVVLAALAAIGGGLNLPFAQFDRLATWLAPAIARGHEPADGALPWILATVTVGVAVGAIAFGRRWATTSERPELEPLVLRGAWGVDDLYSDMVAGPGTALARAAAKDLDLGIIDAAVNGIGAVVRTAGTRLRRVQTGYVRSYALMIAFGSVLVLGFALMRAG